MLAAEAVAHADEITTVVLSALTAAIMAVGAIFAGIMAKRAKSTNDAVHTTDGVSISEQLTRIEGRLAQVEASASGQDRVIEANTSDIKNAHRRIGRVETRLEVLEARQ